MHHTTIREAKRKRPFAPFRIVLTNGRGYDIHSPECILVTGTTTVIAVPGESVDCDQAHLLDNGEIDELIPLPDGE